MLHRRTVLLAILSIPTLGGLSLARATNAHPLNGQIWHTETRTFITRREIMARIRKARWTILGESHDHPQHHALQARIIRGLAERNHKTAIVAEMIAADQAPALALFYEEPRHNAETLRTFLQWDKSGWPAFELYAPIFDAAVLANYPIRAGNLDRTFLKDLHRRGFKALPDSLRAGLDLPDTLPERVAEPLRDAMTSSHCGGLGPELVETFAEIQFARDASLARALMAEPSAILIAGREHARRDYGVPYHLARLEARGDALSIAFVETVAGRDNPAEYDLPFDIVWFTPGKNRPDPC